MGSGDIASNVILGDLGYAAEAVATLQVHTLAKDIVVSAGGLLSVWEGDALITELHSGGRIRTGSGTIPTTDSYGHISGITVIDKGGRIQATNGLIEDVTVKQDTVVMAYSNGTITNIKTNNLFSCSANGGTITDIFISSGRYCNFNYVK